jgi:hypothetical protein
LPLYGPGIESSSSRNEYQGYLLEGKDGRCVEMTTLPPSCADCQEIWEPQLPGALRGCTAIVFISIYCKSCAINMIFVWDIIYMPAMKCDISLELAFWVCLQMVCAIGLKIKFLMFVCCKYITKCSTIAIVTIVIYFILGITYQFSTDLRFRLVGWNCVTATISAIVDTICRTHSVCMYVRMYVCLCMYVCMCVCMYVCMYVCVCVCVYVCPVCYPNS